MTIRRFRVSEESMLPALEPGEEIVVTDSRRPTPGEIVVLLHPYRDGFWLVKRMVEPDTSIPDGMAWVLSDNHEATKADSRSFGPIPIGNLMPRVERLDKAAFTEAIQLLGEEDSALLSLLAEHGAPPFSVRPPGFETLVMLIMEQQLTLESAMATYRRLDDLCGEVEPRSVLEVGEHGLRTIGVSRQKTGYLLGLAEAFSSGAFDVQGLGQATESEARKRLTTLKGVGPWTADVYLLSALRHTDIFPLRDRALQVGTQEALGLSRVPPEDQLELLSQPWRPIRSAAARLIWHGYLQRRGRGEPANPPPVPGVARDV